MAKDPGQRRANLLDPVRREDHSLGTINDGEAELTVT